MFVFKLLDDEASHLGFGKSFVGQDAGVLLDAGIGFCFEIAECLEEFALALGGFAFFQ